jgi:hypothetical protein
MAFAPGVRSLAQSASIFSTEGRTMQRSSSSIAALAAALAKAQGELVNPEKSLVGTIETEGGARRARTFRYAPLSTGLEIVRKTLGHYEIATMQTTAVDLGAGFVNLTTVLAHSSGEWIASDWPVGAVADTATPHRMGAALTYARRYALFTLVGIAGEDDMDAPDLIARPSRSAGLESGNAPDKRRLNRGQHSSGPSTQTRQQAALSLQSSHTVLEAEASAELGNRLVAEIANLQSSDEAALWAHRSLREKNRVTAADAQRVEEAFQAKLTEIARTTDGIGQPVEAGAVSDAPARRKGKGRRPRSSINKSLLPFAEPRRLRDREHVKFVAQQPCLICGRAPTDAHHLRFAQNRALGRKVSDEFTVPLCRGHHREIHRYGDEAAWWQKAGIDPNTAARAFWLKTHGLPTRAAQTRLDRLAAQANSANSRNAGLDRPIGADGLNYKTNPIAPVASR